MIYYHTANGFANVLMQDYRIFKIEHRTFSFHSSKIVYNLKFIDPNQKIKEPEDKMH